VTNYETIKSIELTEAVNRLKKAIDAQRIEVYRDAIQHKGKTLYSVNRTRQNSVRMTIGY
jgi:hypothetical protein